MEEEERHFENAVAALLALASETERVAYEEELAMGPQTDEHGEHTIHTAIQDILLPRLLEKLKSGDWLASGFGYESGQPAELHPRLWQRLAINVQANSAYDSWANFGRKTATGSFHSLRFQTVERTDTPGPSSVKDKTVATIRKLFEELDADLPLDAGKKCFFHKASQELGRRVPEAWLKSAWKSAKIQEARRRPGLKSV